MPGIELFHVPYTSLSRTMHCVASELGITFSKKNIIDIPAGEHLKPAFLAINPNHTCPTIIDHDRGGFILWESRAIMTYFVNRTDPNHRLYPATDIQKRATIDRWLYWELGSLWPLIYGEFITPIMKEGKKGPRVGQLDVLMEKMSLMDHFLSKTKYLASDDNYTLADLSIVSSVSMLEVLDVPMPDLPHVRRWYQGMKNDVPSWKDIHEDGMCQLKLTIKKL